MFEFFKKLLYRTQSENANAHQIAKHLSHILLYKLHKEEGLYPDVKDKYNQLRERMKQLNKPIYFVEGFRTAIRQNELSPDRTQSKALQSYHQYGLAFDVAFEKHNWNPPDDWWNILGYEGKKFGLIWGGDWIDFLDRGHFEWHTGFSWKELEPYFKRSSL